LLGNVPLIWQPGNTVKRGEVYVVRTAQYAWTRYA
jgi:hypothetical protein